MRTRVEIEKDHTRPDILAVELLLDIRDILKKKPPKLGRPKKRKRKEVKHDQKRTGKNAK